MKKFTTIRTAPKTAAAENAGPVPIWSAIAADDRAEQGAADGGAERGAEQLAAPFSRCRAGSQAMPAAQVHAPPEALHESGGVEHDRGGRPAERAASSAHQHQADQHAAPRAQVRDEQPAGSAPSSVPNG